MQYNNIAKRLDIAAGLLELDLQHHRDRFKSLGPSEVDDWFVKSYLLHVLVVYTKVMGVSATVKFAMLNIWKDRNPEAWVGLGAVAFMEWVKKDKRRLEWVDELREDYHREVYGQICQSYGIEPPQVTYWDTRPTTRGVPSRSSKNEVTA